MNSLPKNKKTGNSESVAASRSRPNRRTGNENHDDRLMHDLRLSRSARLVGKYLFDRGRKKGEAWHGDGTIGERLGLSRRSVVRALSELRVTGWVQIIRRGDGKTSMKRLPWHPEFKSDAPSVSHLNRESDAPSVTHADAPVVAHAYKEEKQRGKTKLASAHADIGKAAQKSTPQKQKPETITEKAKTKILARQEFSEARGLKFSAPPAGPGKPAREAASAPTAPEDLSPIEEIIVNTTRDPKLPESAEFALREARKLDPDVTPSVVAKFMLFRFIGNGKTKWDTGNVFGKCVIPEDGFRAWLSTQRVESPGYTEADLLAIEAYDAAAEAEHQDLLRYPELCGFCDGRGFREDFRRFCRCCPKGWSLDEEYKGDLQAYLKISPVASVSAESTSDRTATSTSVERPQWFDDEEHRRAELKAHPERCEKCHGVGARAVQGGLGAIFCSCPLGGQFAAKHEPHKARKLIETTPMWLVEEMAAEIHCKIPGKANGLVVSAGAA